MAESVKKDFNTELAKQEQPGWTGKKKDVNNQMAKDEQPGWTPGGPPGLNNAAQVATASVQNAPVQTAAAPAATPVNTAGLVQPNRLAQIAKANPNASPNRAFIDALYLTIRGTPATEEEFAIHSKESVKDAANLVLGAKNSPFSTGNSNAVSAQPATPATPTPTTPAATTQPTKTPEQVNMDNLIASGQPFTEEDAKNFVYSQGLPNWQKYVGGVGGQPNPNYIGMTEWQRLQKSYSLYQLQQTTEKTPYGAIVWKEGVNINDVPREPVSQTVNKEVDLLSSILGTAKKTADVTTKTSAKTNTAAATTGSLLGIDTGEASTDIYQEVFNTPEMNTAKQEVNDQKTKLDKFDQQLDELEGDIRKEVEGEASESYISAKVTIRGEDILKQRRAVQRDYETALGNYNSLKENASTILELRIRDNETRYNRIFSEIQFIAQRQDAAFNKEVAMTELALKVPAGRTITLPNGSVVKGMAEDDNINAVQFTDADRNTYIIGVDKNTGKEVYRRFIGQSPVPASEIDTTPISTKLKETQAQASLDFMDRVNRGEIGTAVDDKGKAFYYDIKAYETALKQEKDNPQWWNPTTWGTQTQKKNYIISYQ